MLNKCLYTNFGHICAFQILSISDLIRGYVDNGRIRGMFGLNGSKKLIRCCNVGFRRRDVNMPLIEENVSLTSQRVGSDVAT